MGAGVHRVLYYTAGEDTLSVFPAPVVPHMRRIERGGIPSGCELQSYLC